MKHSPTVGASRGSGVHPVQVLTRGVRKRQLSGDDTNKEPTSSSYIGDDTNEESASSSYVGNDTNEEPTSNSNSEGVARGAHHPQWATCIAADGTAPSANCVPPCPNRPWRLVTVVTGSRAACYVSPYHKARDHVSSVTNRQCDRPRRRALWRRARRGYRW